MKDLTALENFSTPLEFIKAAKAMRRSGRTDLAEAVERSLSMTVLGNAATLSDVRCEVSLPHARLFAAPGTSRQRLLVGFTGAASRLMMPLPIILQALPKQTDFLLLHDPRKNHYRSGIWDGECALRDLPRVTAPIRSAYADIIALGTSGGGLPALRFAKQAGLRRGLSFGGRLIDDTLRILRHKTLDSAFDPLCACDEGRRTELVFVYSADHVLDAQAACCAAVAVNSHLVPMVGRSDHNTLWQVQRMGCLPDLFEQAFSASTSDLGEALGAWNESDLSKTRNGTSTGGPDASGPRGTSPAPGWGVRTALSTLWARLRPRAMSRRHQKPRPAFGHERA